MSQQACSQKKITVQLFGDPDLTLADDVEGVPARPLPQDVFAAIEDTLEQ